MNAPGLLSDKRDVDVCWFLVLSVNCPHYVDVCACVGVSVYKGGHFEGTVSTISFLEWGNVDSQF